MTKLLFDFYKKIGGIMVITFKQEGNIEIIIIPIPYLTKNDEKTT